MPKEKPDEQFWEIADTFINLANKHCEKISDGKVSSALLYAAARFNTFIVASNSNNKDQFKSKREEAINYYVDQYRKMLVENLEDYADNYNKYFKT